MKKLLSILALCAIMFSVNAQGSAASQAKTKKDGTPDMRYKANKDVKPAAAANVKLKKDGTPDKRFKANKK
jgi:Ni/Co efflux regulator RcnB